MSTLSLLRPTQNRLPPLMTILLLAALGAGLIVTVHAAQHTMSATILDCDSHNTGLTLRNVKTGRTLKLCEFAPNQWGRLVIENDGKTCVTSFAHSCRSTMNTFQRAVENAYRAGYREIVSIRADLTNQVAEIMLRMK